MSLKDGLIVIQRALLGSLGDHGGCVWKGKKDGSSQSVRVFKDCTAHKGWYYFYFFISRTKYAWEENTVCKLMCVFFVFFYLTEPKNIPCSVSLQITEERYSVRKFVLYLSPLHFQNLSSPVRLISAVFPSRVPRSSHSSHKPLGHSCSSAVALSDLPM